MATAANRSLSGRFIISREAFGVRHLATLLPLFDGARRSKSAGKLAAPLTFCEFGCGSAALRHLRFTPAVLRYSVVSVVSWRGQLMGNLLRNDQLPESRFPQLTFNKIGFPLGLSGFVRYRFDRIFM